MSKSLHTTVAALACAGLSLGLAACSQQESTTPADSTAAATETAAAAEATTAEESATPSQAPAAETSAHGVELTVDPTTDLKPNDSVTVDVTGLNPKLGYYAAICLAHTPEGTPVPVCTGGRGDATAQAWIKAQGGSVTLNEDGSAHAVLAAAATGEGVNCLEDECVVKIFGDHTEGFHDVAQVPVAFAK